MGEARRWSRAGVLLGAVIGGLGTALLFPGLAIPEAVDPTCWQIISPGLREGLHTPQLGRGIHVARGVLVMTEHAFFRPDILVSIVPRPVHRLELTLDAGSAPVLINLGPPPHVRVALAPDRYQRPEALSAFLPSSSPSYAIYHDADGALWLQAGSAAAPERLSGPLPPGMVELSTMGPQSRLTRLRLLGPDQEVLADTGLAGAREILPTQVGAGLVGGLLGAGFLGLVARSGLGLLGGVLGLLVPLGLAALPSVVWIMLSERLYLDQTPAWWLARACVGAAAGLLGARALLATGWLDGSGPRAPVGAERWALRLWGGAVLLAALLGTHPPRDLTEGALAAGGVALLLLPGAVLWRGGLSPQRWLLRDLPVLLGVAALGWGRGLLALLLWRLLVVAGSVRGLLPQAPGPAARYLLALLLLLPLGAELAVRSTYLERAWDGTHLSQELASEEGWQTVVPFWRDRCPSGAAVAARVAFLGGSSTGGAYQLGSEATAFFAAQARDALCQDGGPGVEVINYGTGDANTFTISRTIDQVLWQASPDVLLLYVGANDILTRQHAQTRAQREAALVERQRPVQGLAALGRTLRLITGLSLLVRPLPDQEGTVSAVPVADAEENLQQIARATQASGARVILMTEVITASIAHELADYAAMQRRVADAWPHVAWIDVQALLGVTEPDGLLVDRNHLSRDGNRRLGQALAPVIRQSLAADAPPRPAER